MLMETKSDGIQSEKNATRPAFSVLQTKAQSGGHAFTITAYITIMAVYLVTILEPDLREISIWGSLTPLFFAFTLLFYLHNKLHLFKRQSLLIYVLQICLIFSIVLVSRGFGYTPILYFIVVPTAYFFNSIWQANSITLLSLVSLFAALMITEDTGAGMAAVLLLPYGGGMLFFAALSLSFIHQRTERQLAEKLLAELEDAHKQLQKYAAQVEALAVAEERNRLAREIHDSLGHYLTAITMQLQAAEQLVQKDPQRAAESILKAEDMARESLAEVRRAVSALRTSPMDTTSLDDAIRELVRKLNEDGIAAVFNNAGVPYPVDLQTKTALFRTAQEGLTNVRKHARASAVEVELVYSSEEVSLTILDNGIGSQGENTEGFGLLGLRERVALLDGSLQAENKPESGFQLHVSVPLQVRESQDER